MSRKAISVRVLKRVVKDVGDVFTTKDVSEDPRVMQAHRKLAKHSHYHAFVGGALSDHRDKLGIKEIQKGTRRGSRWQKKRASSGFIQTQPQPRRQAVDHFEVPKEVDRHKEPELEKIVSLVCPSCGGNLEKEAAANRFVCAHCRNQYLVKNGEW